MGGHNKRDALSFVFMRTKGLATHATQFGLSPGVTIPSIFLANKANAEWAQIRIRNRAASRRLSVASTARFYASNIEH